MPTCVLVVPLRDFETAKSRLKDVLGQTDRRALAMACAAKVLDRGVPCERIVVCDDDAVDVWSQALGATSVRVLSSGLNAALSEALPSIVALHPHADIVVAHGDIVDPHRLDDLLVGPFEATGGLVDPDVVIVPDRRHDGTNVLRLSSRVVGEWRFEYGPGSFAKHAHQAESRGWSLVVQEDPGLAIDVDTPDDLSHPDIRTLLTDLLPALRLPQPFIGESNPETETP